MSFIDDLAQQTGSQISGGLVGMGMGMATAGWQDQRQRRQAEKLQEIQIKGMKDMGEFNYSKQMQYWNETNAGAQMKHLKAAGLNPALMYGGGGPGGSTGGVGGASPSGSSAAGGSGEIGEMMGLQMQRELLKAQKENIEADTDNKRAQTEKTGGADTENVRADTAIKKIQADIQELDLDMANDSYKARLARIKNEASESLHNMNIAEKEDWISENTWNTKIQMVEADLIGLGIKNELARAQTDKTWSDIKVNNAQIQNWLVQNAQGWMKLSQSEREVKVTELLGQFNTSLSREALGALGGVITTVLSKGMDKGIRGAGNNK